MSVCAGSERVHRSANATSEVHRHDLNRAQSSLGVLHATSPTPGNFEGRGNEVSPSMYPIFSRPNQHRKILDLEADTHDDLLVPGLRPGTNGSIYRASKKGVRKPCNEWKFRVLLGSSV